MRSIHPMQRPLWCLLGLFLLACSSGAARTETSPVDAATDVSVPDAKHPKDARDAEAKRDVSTIEASPPADAGGRDAAPTVPPLDASAAAWTWVDVPGSACADGTATGFAINPAPAPSKGTLIFLEGGGACWAVSYTHLRAHETGRNLVCRLLLEKK